MPLPSTTPDHGIISLDQIAERAKHGNLWVAVHGKVYDLTDYATDHPGGVDVLRDSAGTDATESFDYAGHPKSATRSMAKFCVGRLEGSHQTEEPRSLDTDWQPPAPTASGGPDAGTRQRRAAMGLVAAVACVALPLLALRGVGGAPRAVPSAVILNRDGGGVGAAFARGMMAAGSVAAAAFAFVYAQFLKTMELEKDVFSYPSVIPNPRRVKRNAAVVLR